MARQLLWIAVLLGCGDSMPGGESRCGVVGIPCGTGCPSPLECVGGACVPVRGDCGGFAGAECQDPALTCTYPQGSSGGICMDEEEKECVCRIAPDVLGDCIPPG